MCEVSAYHEAGHAMMAMLVGARILSVTIDPDWDDGPQRHADIQIQWPAGKYDSREFAERLALVALAGPAAEMIHTEEPFHPGLISEWASDWELAWEAAAPRFRDPRQRLAYLEKITSRAYKTLARDDCWAALATVVDNLLAHETLDGAEVEEIVQRWLAVGDFEA
ncbi:ATP-dependent zinc metalloprotease FtsH [Rosistilla carotiformis]|uniref:ATP-dependent zinc metalloprotease FtsH n=1 Tax=Rosistilla carotiformis TaxID=2528017 RepID=A0A518JQE0_9BACT|nr:hypothetical protein [Rosistilla carotiformis]QDV67738.1 ATP-dependent zinc metalloprotease FtsH [Rosistilla carotiformis]